MPSAAYFWPCPETNEESFHARRRLHGSKKAAEGKRQLKIQDGYCTCQTTH